jgi:hypothetical protein
VLLLAGAAIAPTEATIYAMVDDSMPTVVDHCIDRGLGAASGGLLIDRAGPTAGFALAGGAGALAMLTALLRSRTLASRQAPVITLLDNDSQPPPTANPMETLCLPCR